METFLTIMLWIFGVCVFCMAVIAVVEKEKQIKERMEGEVYIGQPIGRYTRTPIGDFIKTNQPTEKELHIKLVRQYMQYMRIVTEKYPYTNYPKEMQEQIDKIGISEIQQEIIKLNNGQYVW